MLGPSEEKTQAIVGRDSQFGGKETGHREDQSQALVRCV